MTASSMDKVYLTSTGRLARRLRHHDRLSNLERGETGWESLAAMSLNDWLRIKWAEAWPEEIPAHLLFRLHLLSELLAEIPPPAGLDQDIHLCQTLDDTCGTLIRHQVDPSSGPPSSSLVEWRRAICRRFLFRLASKGFFHPAELPSRVSCGILRGALSCPGRIVLAGFDSPAPVEIDLFRDLEARTTVTLFDAPERRPGLLKAVALPSPDQEVLYLLHRVIEDAQRIPLHRIGVVVPDLDAYAPRLEEAFQSLTADTRSLGASCFNISLGKPVQSFPLIKAALLPLKTLLEGATREGLLALLLSPYYRWGDTQKISRSDWVWRASQVDDGLNDLIGCLKRKAPDILDAIPSEKMDRLLAFSRLGASVQRPFSSWLAELRGLWSSLDFPVLSDETDAVAFKHLGDLLNLLDLHLAGTRVNGFDVHAWLSFITAHEMAQAETSEEAGVQVLGLIESRGHDFDKLYILGLSDRSLPQPVRPFPFLDASERRVVQGGTPESQYAFARTSFQRLLSSAPEVILLRPEQIDLEPLSPSPFWPGGEERESVDLWTDPGPSWLRAGWLRAAFEGVASGQSLPRDIVTTVKSLGPPLSAGQTRLQQDLPRSLSLSEMEKALACPCRFFLEVLLGIAPLRDPFTSLYPLERGQRLHRVLALFTREARKRFAAPGPTGEEARRLLADCVGKVLRDVASHPRWLIERRLWLDEKGLLPAWLAMETARRAEGWTVIAEEATFEDLRIGSCPIALKGRIDRIDSHPLHGLLCWDYKTGSHPGKHDVLYRFTAPQLPVYLMALREGAVAGLEAPGKGSFPSIGYWQLKSPSEAGMTFIGGSDIPWDDTLRKWTRLLEKISRLIGSGDFPPRPFPFSRTEKPETLCLSCPVRVLCERGLVSDVLETDNEAIP